MLLRVPMVTLEMSVNVVFWELMERRHEYNGTHQVTSQVFNGASLTLYMTVSISREMLAAQEDQVHLAHQERLDQR